MPGGRADCSGATCLARSATGPHLSLDCVPGTFCLLTGVPGTEFTDGSAMPTGGARHVRHVERVFGRVGWVNAVVELSRLAPVADRCLPVHPALAGLFPDGGLRRGSIVGCSGPAAMSLALALAAQSATAGSWVAAVGVPALGLEAAAELGVPLERLVVVTAQRTADWAERLAAAADGFEILITTVPPGAERAARRVRQRLQARGAVLLAIHPAGRVGCDAEVTTLDSRWVGLGDGHGALLGRRVTARSGGRRVPRPVTTTVWLPSPDGGVAGVDAAEV